MSILLGEADPSAEEQGLEAARLALDPTAEPTTSGRNAGFLRNDAVLAVIFVSDENDFSVLQPNSTSGVQHAWWCDRGDKGFIGWGYPTDATAVCAPVSTYTDFFLNLKGGDAAMLQLSAIVDPGGGADCSSASTGSRYLELMTATAGITERVCEAEMGPAMTRMSEVIANKALTRFKAT